MKNFYNYFNVPKKMNDIILWKLMLLGTKYNEFNPDVTRSKEEYIKDVLSNFLSIGEPVKLDIQRIFKEE